MPRSPITARYEWTQICRNCEMSYFCSDDLLDYCCVVSPDLFRNELHTIVDEVYMLSVFDESVPFDSVLSLERYSSSITLRHHVVVTTKH